MGLTGHNVVALVPAKLSSTRLARKNLADLGGIPLCKHSIQTANECHHIDQVFISTESNEVNKAMKGENCEVIVRDESLSEPHVTNFHVIQHALKQITAQQKKSPDFLVLLQPTHPFRNPEEIDCAIKLMQQNADATCLISVAQLPRAISTVSPQGWWEASTNLNAARKDHLTYFVNIGSFYIFRCATTIEKEIYFGDRILTYAVERPDLDVNIDLPWDLELARLMLEHHPDMSQYRGDS